MDQQDFFTFALMNVKHCHAQTQKWRISQTEERKEQRKLGPPDKSVTLRSDGTTVQLCGDSNVAEHWVNGHYAMGKKHSGKNWRNPKHFAILVEEDCGVPRGRN